MDDTLVTITGMMLAIIIMLIVPLILIADRTDDISQLVAQTVTAEFVDHVIKTGEITGDRYDQFINGLISSGNSYEIDMEIKILDPNTSKEITDDDVSKIGSNTYYSIYTSQVESRIAESDNDKLILKQGDIILVTVRNNSDTLSQTLKRFYYKTRGEGIHIITASSSGTVAIDGAT